MSVEVVVRRRVLPRAPIGARLAAAALVDAFGTGCFLAGSALFFTRHVGLRPSMIGVGLTLSGVLGLATTVPWGRAADRWGARRVLVLLLSVRALAFALYAFAASFAAFLAITALLGLVDKASSPIQQVLVGDAVGEERRQQALAWVRSTRNVGFALGTLAAAAAVSGATALGYDSIVLFNAASFAFAATLMGTLPVPHAQGSSRPGAASRCYRVQDRRYVTLTTLNGVLTIHMSLLSVGLPLWLLEHSPTPAAAIPLLLLINAVLAAVFQVPAAGLVRSTRCATSALRVAGAALAACCLAMPLTSGLGAPAALVVAISAVLALTIAELAQSAGGWDLSFRLAPAHQRGHYLGVFGLGTTAQTMVGPVLLTAVVFPAGLLGWAALAAIAVVAGLLVPAVIRSTS